MSTHAEFLKRVPDPFYGRMLDGIEEVKEAVCRHFGVPMESMKAGTRVSYFVFPKSSHIRLGHFLGRPFSVTPPLQRGVTRSSRPQPFQRLPAILSQSPVLRFRQIAMYLAVEVTHAPLKLVGLQFDRDHGTVMHARQKVRDAMEVYPEIRAAVESLKSGLNGLNGRNGHVNIQKAEGL